MRGHDFERAAGVLALAGAALWAATWAGPMLVAADAPATTAQLVSTLALLAPLAAVPALGGVWLLRRRHGREQLGAGLVAAAGLLVTATVPALLARVFALPSGWQLLGVAAVLALALAGGFAAAALLRNPAVQWHWPLRRRGAWCRLGLLASVVAIAVTMQSNLRQALGAALRDGLHAGVAELQAVPVSLQAIVVIGFGAVVLTGIGIALVRPPAVAAAGGTAVGSYASVGLVHAVVAGQVSGVFWPHLAGVVVLAASVVGVVALERSADRAGAGPQRDTAVRAPQPAHAAVSDSHDAALVQQMHEFVTEGLAADEICVVVATATHRDELEQALTESGCDVAAAQASGSYRPVDAAETLAWVLLDGAAETIRESVTELLTEAADANRGVRVYSGLPNLLWEQGNLAGALALEQMWEKLAPDYPMRVVYGCPSPAFADQDGEDPAGLRQVGDMHRTVLSPGPTAVS